jgi:uncharacterized protein YndB with AHSA1/START domain
MIDIVNQLDAIHRDVSRHEGVDGEEVTVVLRRTYDAEIADLWSAITEPERVKRWFLPLTGDLHVGGKFQFEGNAGGEILVCEPPTKLRVTFGGPASLVEVALADHGGEKTTLRLTHTVPVAMAGSGAGALFVGPGWDGALLGLALYVAGEAPEDPQKAANDPEVIEFSRLSIKAWTAAVEQSGTATADEIAAATAMAKAQFTPDEAQ